MELRQLSGYGVLIGNGALFANGLIAHLKADSPKARNAGIGLMATATGWAGSSLILARYGDRKIPQQLTRLQEKLAAHLKSEGIPLDAETLRKADVETQRGWFDRLEDFLYNHPVEISSAYTAVSAMGMAVSGFLRRGDGNSFTGNANLACSALILSGALANILIPEKTPEQIRDAGQAGTVQGKIQEQPLGFSRWLFFAGDGLSSYEAIGAYRAASKLPKGQAFKPWQFGMAGLSAFATGMFLTSDWLTGASSKKTSGSEDDRAKARQDLLQEAARILSSTPPEMQRMLADEAAQYLAKQPELRIADIKPETLSNEILSTMRAHMPEAIGQHTGQVMASQPVTGVVRS